MVEAHQFRRQTDKLRCHRAVIFYSRLAFFCFLGCHQYDTTGSLATINGSGSILQEVNALNVRRIQQPKFIHALILHTVDNHQRARRVFRNCTAQAHPPALIARSRRTAGNDDTRHLSLQCLHRTRYRTFTFQHLVTDHRHRTCHSRLFLRTVAHNDHFIQHLRVFRQHHFQRSITAHHHFLRLISDVRNHQSARLHAL